MSYPIDPIIKLTLKNRKVASSIAQLLPDGDLTYYTAIGASEDSRDAILQPLWEMLQPSDQSLSFTYPQWLEALRRIALPCDILNDIDALQGWEARHADDPAKLAMAAKLMERKNKISFCWKNMKELSGETATGQIASLLNDIRAVYADLPADFKNDVCAPEALDARLEETGNNIRARFAVNEAASVGHIAQP